MHHFPDAQAVIAKLAPDEPIICNRPRAASRAAEFFVEKFPGKVLYAVKANPSADLLRILWQSGVTHYDVASIAEVRLVSEILPQATQCFMHPVKAKRAIAEAYHQHGVRSFSLDSMEELHKIVEATAGADDLSLLVRLRVSSEYSELPLASKFGIDLADAAELLQATRQHCDALGICFHVGSQAMTPFAYVQALERVRAAIADAAVTVDIVDVGGGFPSLYPDMEPPALEDYFMLIDRHFEDLPISYSAELWAEPGRALAAEYSSLIVKVEKRRGDELFINDGAYGTLFDAAHMNWRFPTKLLGREDGTASSGASESFCFYGPTCDDADFMRGPFSLPEDIAAGDYIEIGMLGAYGTAMATRFNGFGVGEAVIVDDEPMNSLYRGEKRDFGDNSNVVSLR